MQVSKRGFPDHVRARIQRRQAETEIQVTLAKLYYLCVCYCMVGAFRKSLEKVAGDLLADLLRVSLHQDIDHHIEIDLRIPVGLKDYFQEIYDVLDEHNVL